MSSNIDDRLSWLATQYVLGELSEPDRDAFELQMAEDLATCEAVAAATRLTQALQTAFAESGNSVTAQRSPMVKSYSSRFAMGVSIAAIACLFLAMIFWPGSGADPMASNLSERPTREAEELVSRWRSDEKLVDVETDEAEDDVDENDNDVGVPGWLVAGVALEKHGTLDVRPEELQEN